MKKYDMSTQMDKSRDVRRGTSRSSRQQIIINNNKHQQQSRPDLFFGFDGDAAAAAAGGCGGGGGDFVCSEKGKKEKIRRLSSVNGVRGIHSHCETEMGSSCCCDLSSDNNRENQCPHLQHSTTKRFKIPKKFFDDCNAVDHASVPRKLRSAMKKRGCESISPPLPDSKKLNHTLAGVESYKKDGVKKSKLNSKQDWSKKPTVSGPITKDEEEVVETLYALAQMFPDSDSMDKNKLSGESIEVKSSAPPEIVESPAAAIEVKREDTNTVCCPQVAETVPSSNIDESSSEGAKLNSLNEPTTRDQPDMPGSPMSHIEQDSSISQMRLNTAIPSLAKSDSAAEKLPCFPGNFHISSELSLETGLKQPKQQVATPFERNPEMEFEVTAVESQTTQHHTIKEPGKNGLALWPGLSSTVPVGARRQGSSQPCATKIPAWLDAAMCGPKQCSLGSGSSTGKMEDSKDSELQQSFELKPHVGLKQTTLLPPSNSRNLRNGINGTIPVTTSATPATDRSSHEARSGILQQKMFHQDQPHSASTSGMNSSQRQSFDFLSLSAGGVSMEANNATNKAGNGIESSAQVQIPYLHSLPQHQSLVPFSIPPSIRYTSSPYTDQQSTATATQQLQLPQYLSNPFYGPPYTSHSGAKQQQQRLWAAHLAAQYRPGGTTTVLTQFPTWQNGKPESSSTLMSCPQTIIPPRSPLEAVGSKYSTVPQHQQPIIAISSPLTPARVRRQDHHLPSVYEESNGGFRAGGPLPLQLLCNERL